MAWEVLQDKKAYSPVVLDLRGLCGFTDYFVICSADSAQQIKAVAQGVQEKLGKMNHLEGAWDADWVLLDYGDFIVHIFHQRARAFYNLEELWHEAVRIDL